jgi:penicillin-binding protein 1A
MKRRLLVLAGLLVAAGVIGTLLVPVGFNVFYKIRRDDLPPIIDRPTFDEQLWQVSRVYDRHGDVLAEFFRERRTIVPVEELPDHLLHAVVAAEDKRFYQHGGIDWTAVLRAVVVDAARMRVVQGASTLTQQLARNLYLSQERTLLRKVNEMLVALRIEESLSKEEILHQYLNLIYLGHGRYGVEEAAQFYFGKSAREVDLAESALLAGIIKGPEVFSPVKAEEKAVRRMEYVLGQMVSAGFVDSITADGVRLPDIAAASQRPSLASPYGVDAALAGLVRQVGREVFDRGGFRLYTTLDPEWQRAVDQAVADQLPALGVGLDLAETEPAELCNCVQGAKVPTGCAVWAEVMRRSVRGDGYVVSLLGRLGRVPDDALERLGGTEDALPVLQPGTFVKVIPNQEFELDSPWLTEEILVVPVARPQVAAVLMDVETGAVRAVYGGIDHRYHPFNRAITARRPIGSTIKPFIYLAAMQANAMEVDSEVDARCLDLRKDNGRRWSIRDSHEHGDQLTITEALESSSNCAAVRTFRMLGVETFTAMWNSWGLPALDTSDASLALGSTSLSPMELASAYALLGNGKCTPQPVLLERALGRGMVPHTLPPTACVGAPPQAKTHALAQALQRVFSHGTAREARVEGIPTFGKTGTTTGGRDGWLAGVLVPPDREPLVLVVWVGTDDFSELEGNSGPTTAALVWKAIVQELFVN